ncbi:MAG: 50S ribosomal protein L3 [Magnetococcus sp. WYHC-3]
MTQMFLEDGRCLPVTVLKAGPCSVVGIKTPEAHGYSAIQLGFEEAKPTRLAKPVRGQYAKAGISPKRVLKELRVESPVELAVGAELTVSQFAVGRMVDVSGRTIGKGFAGVMKRWGFAGGRASHGAHKVHRSPGSIGQRQTPGRVMKNKKMCGHMGDANVTVQNLEIAHIDAEKNLLVVKGSVPGSEGALVVVRDALKKSGK